MALMVRGPVDAPCHNTGYVLPQHLFISNYNGLFCLAEACTLVSALLLTYRLFIGCERENGLHLNYVY